MAPLPPLAAGAWNSAMGRVRKKSLRRHRGAAEARGLAGGREGGGPAGGDGRAAGWAAASTRTARGAGVSKSPVKASVRVAPAFTGDFTAVETVAVKVDRVRLRAACGPDRVVMQCNPTPAPGGACTANASDLYAIRHCNTTGIDANTGLQQLLKLAGLLKEEP